MDRCWCVTSVSEHKSMPLTITTDTLSMKNKHAKDVQNKLIALHDLDVPWCPADLEQRAGRIVRQGNENKEVNIYRYVTENSSILSR